MSKVTGNSVGDMKVIYIRNKLTTEHPVDSVEEARSFIKINAEKDLKDDSVDVNSFSLLVYNPLHEAAYTDDTYNGWYEWRDENDIDINGYPV